MTDQPGPIRSFFHVVTRGWLGLIGTAVTTASVLLFATLYGIESLGFEAGPYLGIITFVVLPSLFVFGLLLIPLGLAIEKRRARRTGTVAVGALPVVDLNVGRTRSLVLVFLGATLVNLVILAVATYKGIEVMDSTEFCGTTCHKVMSPEFTTYQRSPHARVGCVSCHIGPGADWFVKSKLSGSWQLVSVTFDLYPRPIPTPIHNLRPARETCEQCHWPTKFVGDRLKVLTHYQEDEANSELKTILLLRVGGVQGRQSRGIHWHVDPGVRIRYRSDEKRSTIHEVELTRPDGTVKTYATKTAEPAASDRADGEAHDAWRTMDCLDCHNRPSHIYRLPHNEIDRAMAEGRIDKTLPYIRREGLKALQTDYPTHAEARDGIARAIRAFYAKQYPALPPDRIGPAAAELIAIYEANVFPQMNIRWGFYPTHMGHQDFPGCFRCHDGEHATPEGETISQDCSTCHTILAMEENDPEILKTLNP